MVCTLASVIAYLIDSRFIPGAFSESMMSSPYSVWGGAYWILLAAPFVHLDPFHLLFNMYFFWRIGRVVEGEVGRLRWLAFALGTAVVTSAAELTSSGDTVYGWSGPLFAFVGFVWIARMKVPPFGKLMTRGFSWILAASLVMGLMTILTPEGLGRFESVVRSCNKVLRLDPDYYFARLQRGYALAELGDSAEAMRDLDEVAALRPDDPAVHQFLGQSLLVLGQPHEAIKQFDLVVELDASGAIGYGSRGEAKWNVGDLEGVKVDFERVREIERELGIDFAPHEASEATRVTRYLEYGWSQIRLSRGPAFPGKGVWSAK